MRFLPLFLLVLIGCTQPKKENPGLIREAKVVEDTVQHFTLTHLNKIDSTSFRGLCVVSENQVYISGSRNTFLRTRDGGKTWLHDTVYYRPEYKLDYRDLIVFDSTILMSSAGFPGVIQESNDLGETWKVRAAYLDSNIFFNDLLIWKNGEGLMLGDPISDKIFLMKFKDSLRSSIMITDSLPDKLGVENGFAASGTCMAQDDNGNVWIGLGGEETRVYHSNNYGESWTVQNTPMMFGNESKGIYSICFSDKYNGVAVGGNWEEHYSDSVACYTRNGGKTWNLVTKEAPDGYRSCVSNATLNNKAVFVTCGTSGVDISYDKGFSWEKVDSTNLNAIKFAPNSNIGYATNSYGDIFKVVLR